MKMRLFVLASCLFTFNQVVSQDPEVTTYFGEKNGFQVDFPADWGVELKEIKAMMVYTTFLVGVKGDMPGTVAQIRTSFGCKNPKSEIKNWISIFEKGAKKSDDDKFSIKDQGEGIRSDEKEFSYIDYTYTLKSDDGSSNVIRRKFYIICHNYKMNKYSFQFTFETRELDWDKVSAVYDKIFSSVKFK